MKLLLLIPLLLCGCKVPQGTIVSVTQSVIGIRAGWNPQTQTPTLEVGFLRSTAQFVPTSTNVLHAPQVNSSLSMDQKAFSTAIDEDFQTGGATAPPNSVAKLGAAMRQKLPKESVKALRSPKHAADEWPFIGWQTNTPNINR